MTSTTSQQTGPLDRPLGLRRRPDLEVQPQRVDLERRWAVKDPVSLSYFHLGEEEWFLLEQLDGATSLVEIKSRYDRRFAPRRVTPKHLLGYCNRLHENGLLLAEGQGQGHVLRSRATKQWRQRFHGAMMNPLAIRFRGIDSEGILRSLYPAGRWTFHPLMVVAVVLLWMGAATLLVGQSEQIVQRLPTLADYFQGHNLLWLVVAMVLVKILHELGHGLACVHFGGECHEIGLMLLAFTPCLYCNVSDAWMLPSKWQRIVVSAAGIYVEFILAGICVFLWYFSAGVFNSVCFNIVLVSTVSTFLFNGNPLLRYDGYFILADVTNIPNLFEQSRSAIWGALERWLGGSLRRPPPLDASRGWLVLYGVASATYRVFVVSLILWVLYRGLRANQLRPVGDLLVALTLMGLLTPMFFAMSRFMKLHNAGNSIRWPRWCLLGMLGATVAALLFFVPVPRYLRAPLVLEATDVRYLSAPFDGQLRESVPIGRRVTAGEVVARLDNPQLRSESTDAQGEANRLRRHVENLKLRANADDSAARDITTAEVALHAAEQRVIALQEKIQRLRITAPIDGVVIPAPYRDGVESNGDSDLLFWTGTPLDEQNEFCHVKSGELMCLIGNPTHLDALVLIGQDEIELTQVGCQVWLRVDQLPGRLFSGRIQEISHGEVPLVPRALAATGELSVKRDASGAPRPLETSYYARVQFAEPLVGACHGSGGFAKIVTRWEPIGMRLLRHLSRTFRFQL